MIGDLLIFAGGIGLFLLGMRQMTDGLKVAAGNALRNILHAATRSPMRGIASGLAITTAVQSSSAVIFATIGFVNVGLLNLAQSIGIVYGSNLGTTLTSWIVALIGFNVDLRALALPAIGIGMALWVSAGTSRRGALGQAIAGLGLFFLGIDILRSSFEDFGAAVSLDGWAEHRIAGIAAFLIAGIVLTVLMQSSSAALAVTLTAAGGGFVPITSAAAMIIGANVGTTSTAVFASIGATSPAKRVAAAHVTFNLVTGVAALLLLPVLLWLAQAANRLIVEEAHVAVSLAIFHTLTKLLGIGIMVPLTGRLVTILEKRFRSAEEDEARPHYLDKTTLTTPTLAVDAIGLELRRMGAMARKLCADALSSESSDQAHFAAGRAVLENLQESIGTFSASIDRDNKDPELVNCLPTALRVAHYYVAAGELAQDLARLQSQITVDDAEMGERQAHLHAEAAAVLLNADVDSDGWDEERFRSALDSFQMHYQTHKAMVLRAGTRGAISARRMAAILEHGSHLHRACEQAAKAALHMHAFLQMRAGVAPPPVAAEASAEAE